MTQAAEAGPALGLEPGQSSTSPSSNRSRRDRLRAATTDEIVQTARRLLVEKGPEAVTLRAIAREMGMTAPGLYRYFGSHEELIRRVIAGIFTELGHDIDRAISAAHDGATKELTGNRTPEQRTRRLTIKMAAACREFRRWALNHRAEFALLFGVPLPGLDHSAYDCADECALEFAGVFFALFVELWHETGFEVMSLEHIDPGLRAQITRYRDLLGTDVPLGALLTFLRCWILLYGAVSMEMFGHLSFALEDPAPMFEITLSDVAALVGLAYPLPDA